jgi:hypothetical protein
VPDLRQKTISYHRAEWYSDHKDSINLGLCIKQSTDRLRTIPERSIQRAGGYMMRLAYFKPDDENHGYFLHITFETPGEHASVVPSVSADATEVRVSTLAPPNDAEFMDGDAFFYVNRNDACLCATSVSLGSVRYFLNALFEKAKIRSDAGHFDFFNAVDTRKFALIQSKGVREIEIKASLYKASADYNKRKKEITGVLGASAKHIKAILGIDHDVTDDSLRVALTLTVDKRHKGGIVLGHKRMEQVANDIIKNETDEDEYVIVLESGEKIKPRELILKSPVSLDSVGKSVARDKAWDALREYYVGLRRAGQLEI